MDTLKQIDFSAVGTETGSSYSGVFKVKTSLSRRDRFQADAKRREVLGPLGEGALSTLQGEAFMIGQLSVRIMQAPDWWSASANGLDLKDENVTPELFEACLEAERETAKLLQGKAKEALERLAAEKKED